MPREHVHGYPDNQREWIEAILGRGKGDPDVYGYPGEKEAEVDKLKDGKDLIELLLSEPRKVKKNQDATGL